MTKVQGKNKRKLFFFGAGLVLFFLSFFIPHPPNMTPLAARLLGLVALMACWWISDWVPLAATALLPLLSYPLLGIMPAREVAPYYSHHLIFLFLGGFMIALAIERWNLHQRIALTIIQKIGTNPQRIVLGFMIASSFLSMWISNTATTMMLLPVALVVVKRISSGASLDGHRGKGVKRAIQEGFGGILMLGLAYSASIGGLGTLIGSPPNIIFAGFYNKSFSNHGEISFFNWMLMTFPLVVSMIPLLWIYLCHWVSPFPLHKIEMAESTRILFRQELKKMGPLKQVEKFLICVFLMTALLWLFRKPLIVGAISIPGWSDLFSRPDMIHDSTVAIGMGILLMVFPLGLLRPLKLKGRDHVFVLDWQTVQKGVPWNILFLFGGGFALAAGFSKTGLDLWFGQLLVNWASLPLWIALPAMCLCLTMMSEFTSNTATATMILPIIAATAEASGVPPLLLMFPAALSLTLVFMMPIATPPNAIVMGSGWVPVSKMVRTGIPIDVLGALGVTLLTLIWVKGFFFGKF